MPPDNIFDRQVFGDLSQFDTTCAFVRSIIEPTISIFDSVATSILATANLIFTTRIKKILDSTTRIRKTLDFTTRIKDKEDRSI